LRQFEVYVQNKPGEVARLAEVLAKNAVNVRGIATDLGGSPGVVRVITDDEASARRALSGNGLEFKECDVLVISLPDKPGELAKATKKLARAGVNIESLFILGSKTSDVQLAVGVDQREKAQDLLFK
jgi:hypothetical protein